ncbi:MAG: hypothetical protein ACXAD7_06540 [Candidatus Kariarchaeaceae archaeon]
MVLELDFDKIHKYSFFTDPNEYAGVELDLGTHRSPICDDASAYRVPKITSDITKCSIWLILWYSS